MDPTTRSGFIVGSRASNRLPKDASCIVFVRGLPFKITPDEIYDIFGKYGSIRQIRKGILPNTRGAAFVIYDNINEAKNAVDNLSGFNVAGRYLIVSFYNPAKEAKRAEERAEKNLNEALRERSGFL